MMKKCNNFLAGLALLAISAGVSAQPLLSTSGLGTVVSATDANGTYSVFQLNDGVTLTGTWRMDMRTYVLDGRTVFMSPGTVIKADYIAGTRAAAFVVCRGGKIYANGTESNPIIFTSVDDVNANGSYSVANFQKWGGVIILGKAKNSVIANQSNPEDPGTITGVSSGLGYIEGLPVPDSRHWYGATALSGGLPVFDNEDNSGVLRYVSIRHAGQILTTNNEINGLTMGSVGRGTTIEHIEVVSNADDGIEFFGGTVDMKYVNVMFCDDDYIDWDQSYDGRIQFVLGIQLPSTVPTVGGVAQTAIRYGDNGFEMDGDDGYSTLRPATLSNPKIFNATIIGSSNATNRDVALELKERTQGTIANSIFANFGTAVQFDQAADKPTEPLCDYPNANGSYTPNPAIDTFAVAGGNLVVRNNLFINCGQNVVNWAFEVTNAVPTNAGGRYNASLTAAQRALTGDFQEAALVADGNIFDAASTAIDWDLDVTITDGVDAFPSQFFAIPSATNPQIATSYLPLDGFFDYAPYKGAFEPGKPSWLANWTVHEDKGTGTISCSGDLTNDYRVNASDFAIVVSNYNSDCTQ